MPTPFEKRIKDALAYLETLQGLSYNEWTDYRNDTSACVEESSIPVREELDARGGICCVGVSNLLLHWFRKEIPGLGPWKGGTDAYYTHFSGKGVAVPYSKNTQYPPGTLLIRPWYSANDVGHVAVVVDDNVQHPKDTWIIHSFPHQGVKRERVKYSHNWMDGEYYKFVVYPEKWLH